MPALLDGRHGTNRAPAKDNHLQADDDAAAVAQFLAEYEGSPSTQRAYAREVERLLLWAVEVRQKALSSLNREDFAAYSEFLRAPHPQERWCGPKRARKGKRFTAGWRPFEKALGTSAHRTALVILNSLMNYLVQARYLGGNPLALIRQRHRVGAALASSRRRVLQRSFDNEEWHALLDHIDARCAVPEVAAYYERVRFVVALMFFLALRIGEVETHTMGSFHAVRDRWYFFVTGKGNKEASIPVGDAMLIALQRYRHSLKLLGLPPPDDTTPLLLDLYGERGVSARRMNQVIKEVVQEVASSLEAAAPHRAAHMRQASAHWFRHTAITRQAEKGIHFSHLQANARHSKLDTTMLYVHLDEDLRHAEMEKHTWR